MCAGGVLFRRLVGGKLFVKAAASARGDAAEPNVLAVAMAAYQILFKEVRIQKAIETVRYTNLPATPNSAGRVVLCC